eukprot:CAMPEP_0198600276 /NCGR_PEP_ID=MMETSP1462-20131121/148044_1 /TAXON_ID=1333877 /ORGANISM="Brandtodinium nutriculum, Strain RCC3387" /LENGTH=81 /DNA_ID=CAMNT_0044331985 /DNA_START=26 /DNA_END=267 /DNA_ORIENTATION=-
MARRSEANCSSSVAIIPERRSSMPNPLTFILIFETACCPAVGGAACDPPLRFQIFFHVFRNPSEALLSSRPPVATPLGKLT